MQFNKLYNIILQNIITEDKANLIARLKKNNIKNAEQIGNQLSALKNNKLAEYLCDLICSLIIDNVNDPRVEKVKTIISVNPNINLNQYQIDELIDKFYKSAVAKIQNQTAQKRNQYLDSIKVFSQKRDYGNSVVIYKVQDSMEAVQAVRKIIDNQLGYDSNPWCLVTRTEEDGLQTAYKYWMNVYNCYPKHIAFYKGKLFALCANNREQNVWWNLQNQSNKNLIAPNYQIINVPNYVWNNNERVQNFVKGHNLIYNQKTGLYDSNQTGSFYVHDNELYQGHFPVPMGDFKCKYFGCTNSQTLTSLINAPRRIQGDFNLDQCRYLKTLKGGPEYVGGLYICDECRVLTDLHGAPKYVGKDFWIRNCKFLQRLDGMENTVINGNFDCSHNLELKSLRGGPKQVGRNYELRECYDVQSFVGLPEKIGGYLECSDTYRLGRYIRNEQFKKKYRIKIYESF